MSSCACDSTTSLRVTGEIMRGSRNAAGPGDYMAQVRCNQCEHKIGYVGSGVLELFQVPSSHIEDREPLGPGERVHIEVTLL
jgi:hypothetical protein